MRILIVGGTRFIGPFVVRSLLAGGHDVTVLHRGQSEGDLPDEVHHIHHPAAGFGQRDGLGAVRADIAALGPDVVVDMVPLTEGDARALAAVVRGIAGRLVAVSSQDVYLAYDVLRGKEPGPPVPVPLDEDAPLRRAFYPYRPETPRAPDEPRQIIDDYDKILVEQVVLGHPDLPGTVLRLPMVYGPGDYQHRCHSYLKRMDDGRPAIILDARMAAWRDTRGYVADVAGAIALAATDPRASGRVYNVAEPEARTEAGWIAAIARAAGWSGEVVVVDPDRLPESLRADINAEQSFVVDTTRIRTDLGYAEATDYDAGLARTIEWERANPPRTVDPSAFDYAAEDEVIRTAIS
jgi:nucleoside-diphosphate-sugar epimerase